MSRTESIDYNILRSKGISSRYSDGELNRYRRESRTKRDRRSNASSTVYPATGPSVAWPHTAYVNKALSSVDDFRRLFDRNSNGNSADAYRSRRGGSKYGIFVILGFVLLVAMVAAVVSIVMSMKSADSANLAAAAQHPSNEATDTTLTLVFTNVFISNLASDPSTTYSVLVSTDPTKPSTTTSNTWAAVQVLQPQPPYIAIYQCSEFFTIGDGCAGRIVKRQTSAASNTVTAVLGKDSCNKSATNQYCNGPLTPNTTYYVTMRAENGGNGQLSAISGPFTTTVSATTPVVTTSNLATMSTSEVTTAETRTPTTTSDAATPTAVPTIATSSIPQAISTFTNKPTTVTLTSSTSTTSTTTSTPTTSTSTTSTTTGTPTTSTSTTSPTTSTPTTSTSTTSTTTGTPTTGTSTTSPMTSTPTTSTSTTSTTTGTPTTSTSAMSTSTEGTTTSKPSTTKSTLGTSNMSTSTTSTTASPITTTTESTSTKGTTTSNIPKSSSGTEVGTTPYDDTTSSEGTTQTTEPDTTTSDSTTTLSGTESTAAPVPDPEVVFVEKNDISLENAGIWAAWSAFSSCPTTCGGGFQTRTRVCETLNTVTCSGTAAQIQDCNKNACPKTVQYGKWRTWSDWSTCSQNCGKGNQTRSRTCDMTGAQTNCVGSDKQERFCNDFVCPSCSDPCPGGTVSPDCGYCQCNQNYTFTVRNANNMLVIGAMVTPYNDHDTTLVTSGNDGRILMYNQCSYNQYRLWKRNYVELYRNGSELENTNIVYMDKIQPIIITKSPESRVRLTGESVTFCLEVTGNLLPHTFEWFKDGVLIETQPEGVNSSFLELSDLSIADSGDYSCRASNDHTAVKSVYVSLTVKANRNDFCPTIPYSKLIGLPSGCSFNGNDSFDKGECSSATTLCRSFTAENGSCEEVDPYCCGPLSFTRVDIPCDNNRTIPVMMVTSCGCVPCPETDSLVISGTAAGLDGTPLFYGVIRSNGQVISSTDRDGGFSFQFPDGMTRMALLFQDTYDEIFMDSIYVVDVPLGLTGVKSITVSMFSKGKTYNLSSAIENTIELTKADGAAFADINIPGNAFYLDDGTLYTGEVKASVAIIDPSNITELTASPGDFTATDSDGNQQQLDTYGMFSFDFRTPDDTKLSIPGDIQLSISSDQIGNDTDGSGVSNVKLWRINTETGEWEVEGDLVAGNSSGSSGSGTRKKRQIATDGWGQKTYNSTIRGLSVATSWFNFDAIRHTACYSKIRVYQSVSFLKYEQIKGAELAVVVQTGGAGVNSISRYRAKTDDGDKNGYCIIHACNSPRKNITYQFKGWIFGDHNGNKLIPVNPLFPGHSLRSVRRKLSIGVDSDNIYSVGKMNLGLVSTNGGSVSTGPFYDWVAEKNWPYSPNCSEASYDDAHFSFITSECKRSYDVIPDDINKKLRQCNPKLYRLWFSYLSLAFRNEPYNVLFIKVYTPNAGQNATIHAFSSVSKGTPAIVGGTGDLYGHRQDCPNQFNITCIEVKGPTEIACAPKITLDLDSVDITVYMLMENGNFQLVSGINSALTTGIYANDISIVKKREFRMTVRRSDYGPIFGLYWGKDTNRGRARNKGYTKCMSGSHNAGRKVGENADNWAVKFG